jgi:hypothetical protein
MQNLLTSTPQIWETKWLHTFFAFTVIASVSLVPSVPPLGRKMAEPLALGMLVSTPVS